MSSEGTYYGGQGPFAQTTTGTDPSYNHHMTTGVTGTTGYYPSTHTLPWSSPVSPSYVTHYWAGPNPDQLAAAMNRLAAAIEKQNELAAK